MGARGMGFTALSSTARRGISDNVSPVHEAVIPRTQTSQHTRDTAPCRGAPAVAVALARGSCDVLEAPRKSTSLERVVLQVVERAVGLGPLRLRDAGRNDEIAAMRAEEPGRKRDLVEDHV